jgi:cysteine-rich repeat protein
MSLLGRGSWRRRQNPLVALVLCLPLTGYACGSNDDAPPPGVGQGATGGSAGSGGSGRSGNGGSSDSGASGKGSGSGAAAGEDAGAGGSAASDAGSGGEAAGGSAGDGAGGSANAGSGGSAGAGSEPEHCADGIDNDDDGETDCDDEDCEEPCARPCESTETLSDPGTVEASNANQPPAPPNQCVSEGPALNYEVTVATTGMLEVEVEGSALLTASISSACDDPAARACGFGRASAPVTAGERVFVRVAGVDPTDQTDFSLSVRSRAANVCADGYRDPEESCDDANEMPGDGCDATCAVEADETEPNAERGAASPFAAPFFAEIAPAGDEDFVVFDLAERASILIETLPVGDDACARTTQDSAVELFDGSGDFIAADDDGGDGYCARLVYPNTDAGRYFVRVTASATGDTPTFPYELSISWDVCGNSTLAPGEECDDGNTEPDDGCDPICQNE